MHVHVHIYILSLLFATSLVLQQQVLDLYREIEQKRGLKIRVLPIGSTTLLKDVVKANRDTRARQSLARKSGDRKRSSDKITDDVSSPNNGNNIDKEGKKSKKKKIEKAS